jgi:hypothetical protein
MAGRRGIAARYLHLSFAGPASARAGVGVGGRWGIGHRAPRTIGTDTAYTRVTLLTALRPFAG